MRRDRMVLAAAGLVVIGLAVVMAAPTERPDVIIITVNGFRADHLTCGDAGRNLTPRLCELADDGIRYRAAYSQAAYTPRSQASILTGLYPVTHGFDGRGDSLPQAITTLPEVFQRQGYQTIGFGSARSAWPPGTGIRQGFDRFWNNVSAPVTLVRNISVERSRPTLFYAAMKQLHRPYRDSPLIRDTYTNTSYNGTLRRFMEGGTFSQRLLKDVYRNETGTWMLYDGATYRLRDQDLAFINDQYDNTVRYVDRMIGGLMRSLQDQGRYEDSLIIITAPHGQTLDGRSRQTLFTSFHTYEEVIRVPLIIKPPGGRSATVDEKVELIDLYPTVLSYLDLSEPDGMVQGREIRPPVEDRQYIHAFPGTIRGDRWKLMHPSETEQWLFDLRQDPGETRNVIKQRPAVSEQLRDHLGRRIERGRIYRARIEEVPDT